MKVRLLTHPAIDRIRYDACLSKASNSRIYALSWYLDIVSPGWQLLVIGDYEYIMPLPYKKKYGMQYLIQPPLCQQLGIFSDQIITPEIIAVFFQAIPYRFCILHLNSGNPRPTNEKPNFVLPLSKSYTELRSAYRKDCRYRLNTAENWDLSIEESLALDTFIDFVMRNSVHYIHLIHLLREIINHATAHKSIDLWAAYSKNGDLLAAVLFLNWNGRAYYLVSVSSPEGKEKEATRFILDCYIKKHAGTDLVFDFEGSSIQAIASFFKGFGAVVDSYPVYFRNNMPWPISQFLSKKFFLVHK